MTGKGEKQKGDETQLQGKDVCVRGVCLCVSVRARARAPAPSPVKRGFRSREHLPKEPSEPWWVQTAPSSHGGCVSGFHTRGKRSAKLSAWSLLAASTCRSSSELALSLPGGCTVLGYVQRSLLPKGRNDKV